MDGKYTDDQAEAEKPVQPPSTSADNEQADYKAASQATVDYSQFMPLLKAKKKWPRVVGWTLLVLIVLGSLGSGGWWYANQKSPPKQAQSNQHKGSRSSNSAATLATKHYDSSDLNLGLDYPENWTVADSGGKLTVTSPVMQLTDASGQQQNGQVVMTIQNENAVDFSAFKQGSAVAVLDSQKVAYTKPTSTQRADTYVSFLQYAATTTHGALDGIYVTGDLGYKYGQTIPESDITKIDPDIRIAFVKCSDASCKITMPISVSSSWWKSDSNFSVPVVNMLKSLAIQ